MRAQITGLFSTAYASFKQDCPALLRAIAAFAVLCWVILVVAMLAGMGGCSTTSRTKVDGAATEASHRVEQPGVTRTKTTKLRIGYPKIEGSGTGHQGSGVVAPMGRVQEGGTPSAPRMQSVAWAKPKVDPVAEAIREAAANGVPVEYEFTESESVPLGVTESTLSDRGASLVTSSDEAAIGFEGSKSGAWMPWGKRSGDSSFGLTADLTRVPTSPLVWVGVLPCLAAIIPLLRTPRRWGTALTLFGVGVAIIGLGVVATTQPWLYAVGIVLALGVAGYFGYEAWRNGRRGEALNAIVTGVQRADDTGGVREAIAKAAPHGLYDAINAEVDTTRRKLGLTGRQD